MDFSEKIKRFDAYRNRPVLPFYMTYPVRYGIDREESLLRDLEYLQNTYPAEVKCIANRVAEVLDRVDYEGSMIYDEYPDGYSIGRMAHMIADIVQKEERQREDSQKTMVLDDPVKKEWMEYLCRVLLSDEIYKRRHGGRRGKFL